MRRTLPLLILLAAPALGSDAIEAAREYKTHNGPRILRDFAKMLALPNVASDHANIRRNAGMIRAALEKRGVRSELLTLPDASPIVYGMLARPGAKRTLGVYLHYDGQPVDPAKWTNSPWKAALYTRAIESGGKPRAFPKPSEAIDLEWRIYARSAGDDKAPLAAILTTLDALHAANIAPTSNLIFFFEGEEEAGSTHLRDFLEKIREKIDPVDAWLICDGPVHQSRRPQLVFGVRGVTGLQVTVYGATRPLHSGHYGNWAPNPALMLARLLASMKDEHGRVLVDGFYDSVAPLSTVERTALRNLPNIDDALRREMGLAQSEADNAPYAERLLLPSLNIRGLETARVGSRTRNVIPSVATAALGMRLVKGNHPQAMQELVEAHIRRQGYLIVREDPPLDTRLRHAHIAKVIRESGYRAARTSMDLPIVRRVIAATERAADGPIVLLPSLGGSLPLYLFTDSLGKPAVIVPIANHDDNQHAADENLRVANLWYGIDLMASLFTMPADSAP